MSHAHRHVHRHFKRLENLLYMYNITFSVEDDGFVHILGLTLHPITAEGIVDHNVIPENVELTSAVKLNVLRMLYADGIIVLD